MSGDGVAFQPQAFQHFVALVGRLFYDDACIVLLDFLAREQCAFQEAELRERLGWREALIQQKLYLLEKHQLIVQDGPPGGRASVAHWRINDRIYAAVTWRLEQVVNRLSKLVSDAGREHEFECPQCNALYSTLDAASCARSLEDEHPLCSKCSTPLKPSEFEETKRQAKEKKAAALTQLEPLRAALQRISSMRINIFPHYSRRNAEETPAGGDGSTNNNNNSAPVAGAASVLPNAPNAPNVSNASNASSIPSGINASPSPTINNIPANATSNALKSSTNEPQPKPIISLKLNNNTTTPIGTIAAATKGSRAIPWFDRAGAGTNQPINEQQPRNIKITFGLKPTPSAQKLILATSRNNNSINTGAPAPAAPGPNNISSSSSNNNDPTVKVGGIPVPLSTVTKTMEEQMSDSEYAEYYALVNS